jgi:hypothetical protein
MRRSSLVVPIECATTANGRVAPLNLAAAAATAYASTAIVRRPADRAEVGSWKKT